MRSRPAMSMFSRSTDSRSSSTRQIRFKSSVSRKSPRSCGKITNWSEFGGADRMIKVLRRDDKSGTFDTFKSLVLAPSQAEVSPHVRAFSRAKRSPRKWRAQRRRYRLRRHALCQQERRGGHRFELRHYWQGVEILGQDRGLSARAPSLSLHHRPRPPIPSPGTFCAMRSPMPAHRPSTKRSSSTNP